MNIELLANRAEVIPILSAWYQLEWEPYYGPGGPGDARADLLARCNLDKMPIGLLAMHRDEVLGTVALGLDTATNLAPSVVGLLVRREQRERGIATALLEAAENLARQLGYDQLYISTEGLGGLLARRGWRRIGEVEFLNSGQGTIHVREF